MTIQASSVGKGSWGREVGEALKGQVLPLGESGEVLGKPFPLVVSDFPIPQIFPMYFPALSRHFLRF